MSINFSPIGIIKTSFENKTGVPIQAAFGAEHAGVVELDTQFVEGLKDLDGFSHIHLIYHFNQHSDYGLTVRPYMDETPRGLFATRAPKRPNGIGLSLVSIDRIENNKIFFLGVDILNNTPLLDIKPYYSKIDSRENSKCGWLDRAEKVNTISDDRF